MIPRRGQEPERADPIRRRAQRLVVPVAVPRAEQRVEARLHEVLRRGRVRLGDVVLPVRDHDALVQLGQHLVRALIRLRGGHVRTRPGRRVQQLIAPDDRPAPLPAQLLGQAVQVAGQHGAAVLRGAERTGRVGIGFVAAQMEVMSLAAQLDQLAAHGAQQLQRIGIGQAPRPAIRLEQQRPCRILIQHDVLSVAAAALAGVSQMIEHRNRLHAQIVDQLNQRAKLVLGIRLIRPAQFRHHVVFERCPELQHDVRKLHQPRQPNRLFEQNQRRFREDAQMNGAHPANRRMIVDFDLGQRALKAALRAHGHDQLEQREQRVPQAGLVRAAHKRALRRHAQRVFVLIAQRGADVPDRVQHGAVCVQRVVAHHGQLGHAQREAVPQALVLGDHAVAQRGAKTQHGLFADAQLARAGRDRCGTGNDVSQNHTFFLRSSVDKITL